MELCVIWHKIKYFKKGAEPPAGVTIYRVPFGKMTYKEFLASKRFVLESSGFDIDKTELNPMLYERHRPVGAQERQGLYICRLRTRKNTHAVIVGIPGT